MNWSHWFERWEAMQSAYLPQRQRRFDLMFRLPNFPHDAPLRILDLGCGPGSVTFAALRHYPNARVVAVDADPVLLAMGKALADQRISGSARQRDSVASVQSVEFVLADLRDGAGWAADGEFDLVVSATALHWLTEAHLAKVYRRVFRALKPGGAFFNADHIAADDPAMQAHYRDLLHAWQRANFDAGAEDWDGFWRGFEAALAQDGIPAQREAVTYWEGTDDGLPRQFHLDTLRACGFADVAVHWQDLGEVLVGARKPL
ncbi:MAG TPA: methyltransferase domain-containing protein [Anaerolineae bacterium]|nr:methyltransferase domain-containing protein [Anaerolineae bacterium]